MCVCMCNLTLRDRPSLMEGDSCGIILLLLQSARIGEEYRELLIILIFKLSWDISVQARLESFM